MSLETTKIMLSDKRICDIREQFKKIFTGPNAHKIIILDQGLKLDILNEKKDRSINGMVK